MSKAQPRMSYAENAENAENAETAETDKEIGRIEQAEPSRQTVPVARTTEEEEREFLSAHDADRPPTPEEEALADRHGALDAEVAAQAKKAAEMGAEVKGEGEIR